MSEAESDDLWGDEGFGGGFGSEGFGAEDDWDAGDESLATSMEEGFEDAAASESADERDD